MVRIERDYRLGNIIDEWYAQLFVSDRKTCGLRNMLSGNTETFGNYLGNNRPQTPDTSVISIDLHSMKDWWWCYFYSNFKAVYPHFTKEFRRVIQNYLSNASEFHDGTVESEPKKLVIHLRVGDFLNHPEILNYSKLVDAIDLLPEKPESVEILSSGAHFRANNDIYQKSCEMLQDLCKKVKEKLPNADVTLTTNISNADYDFFKMVKAPYLITGAGSFAIFAAAANTGYRLTPALKNLNFPHLGTIPQECIYENWHTYEC